MARSCRAPKRSPGAGARPCNRSSARPCRRRGRTCGGGRMRGPLLDLLFTGCAEARTILAVAAWTTLAVLVAAAHHRRRALLVLVDLDGEEADHILVDVRLALELGNGRGRRVDVEHYVMRLAVLRDAVSEGAQTPGLGL